MTPIYFCISDTSNSLAISSRSFIKLSTLEDFCANVLKPQHTRRFFAHIVTSVPILQWIFLNAILVATVTMSGHRILACQKFVDNRQKLQAIAKCAHKMQWQNLLPIFVGHQIHCDERIKLSRKPECCCQISCTCEISAYMTVQFHVKLNLCCDVII